jgi:hypothetical protein
MIARLSLVAALVFTGVAVAPNMASASVLAVCASGCPYTTIQAAVNASNPGDTIDVSAGTYAESVTVNKSLVLNGAQAGVDGRDPSRTAEPSTESIVTGSGNDGKTPFDVTANDVTIDGFTVEGATNSNAFGTNLLVGAGTSGETIEDNVIESGIQGVIRGSSSSTIRQNLIENNNAAGPGSGTGLYTDQFDAGGALSGDTIDSNSFVNDQTAGVLLGPTDASAADSGFTISANTFTGDGNGLFAANLTDSSFTRNVVSRSLDSQVVLTDGVANVDLSENFIQSGATDGLRILNMFGGANVTGVTFTCNRVTGNATSGLSITSGQYAGTLNALTNWWGSQTGPKIATNPKGTGQSIVDPDAQVSYRPFLVNGTDSNPKAPGFQCTPKLTISNAQAAETKPLRFTVTLNNPSRSPVTVAYTTLNGTAKAGVDYRRTSGTLRFPPGARVETITVRSLQDNGKTESKRTFKVELSKPSGGSIARGLGVGTIVK